MKKGQLSVFFALIMTVILSLILTCIEGSRISAIGMQTECVMDMGLDSAFAEYHRELLEQYDLFFIDSSYGTITPSYHYTEEHLRKYMEYNFESFQNEFGLNIKDFNRITIDDVWISEARLATDGDGEILKLQAINYMKDKIGLDFIKEIEGKLQIVEDHELDMRDIKGERSKVEEEISNTTEEMKEEYKEEYEEGWIEIDLNNPADVVNKTRNKGILNMVIKETSKLSSTVINPANYVSRRIQNKGIGFNKKPEISFSKAEDILFVEYLMEKMGNYSSQKEKGELKYQLEYLLAGKNTDIDNLKWVANRLILLREVANVTYLFSDKIKVAEAEALAGTLTAISLTPYLQPLVKNSILFAWAYAESIQDVKLLFSGGKIPLIKTKNDWHLTLTNMFDYKNHLEDTNKDGKGLNYEMYLRILLCMEDNKEQTQRCMDIMEMDIRKTEGNKNFRMDGCIDSITTNMNVSSGFGYIFYIKRSYSYS